ncbi:alpha/beta hydrolase [Amycolatopsis sp. CA-230715]|uniref:alpha/beta hydrolase n=1 Tax=Amycolatopsis sp. CA-230715 TaxID=2745196 RepID=UPI001C02D79A|nr:alpha/beta hydrolase [Amycolatopsis sp. CA-230715]QWF76778.1 Tripeptidyl aminopeptidase [Amycolatopsis sp. CA-230715]
MTTALGERMHKFRTAVLAAALGTTLATTVAPAEATPKPSLSFDACPGDLATPYPGMTCASVQVPLDYAAPEKGQLTLLVSKVPARDPAKRRGALFVNPGGPGAGAASYVGKLTKPDGKGATRLPPSVLDSYDIIGMDPRGVGHSSPFACVDPGYFGGPQPDPDATAGQEKLWQTWTKFAAGCQAKAGAVLPHLGTVNVAKDMDLVREKMGERKLSYLGFSYGTYLGAVYGELFGPKIDRMILDGNVNPEPEDLWYQAGLTQPPAVQKRVTDWLTWVAKYDSVFHLGGSAAETTKAWNAALEDFRAHPHGSVGVNELLGLAFNVMFAEVGWEDLGRALSDYAVKHDDSALVGMASPDATAAGVQKTSAFQSVICADSAWPADHAVYERDTAAVAKSSQFAWYNTFTSGAACASWPVPHGTRAPVTGKGMPKILMFNSVGDPATPYAGAVKLHKALPGSVLVTERDSGKHCVFANPIGYTNDRAQQLGAAYLTTGQLPPSDTTIAGHPVPGPSGTAAAEPQRAPA